MERKIFNSHESRIKLDLDLTPCCWWLRSREWTSYSYPGYVYDCCGIVCNYLVYGHAGVLPVCTI